ncbi:hypothetical protein DESC_740132 [Desulfosarcina cetonica]|nr:hypothetical protein DESC_740132 [Desulfosarcina cetonica]
MAAMVRRGDGRYCPGVDRHVIGMQRRAPGLVTNPSEMRLFTDASTFAATQNPPSPKYPHLT